ncbi:MarR family transcriptional regulator [Actinosynnema sp. NPDC023658]|uniref:MarR family winged helix-turn-helix transcriptional regulator n=1 Tax=Actinosynnema sp. NPDC023658 TaxID=3155465 RepID=UPI0033D7188E
MTTQRAAVEDTTKELRGLVYELSRRLSDHVRASVADLDLTETQANALRDLNEPLTMGELAERMCCEPPNVTFVIDRLQSRGLVERQPHPTDRRAKHLVLTAAGHELRERLLRQVTRDSPLAHLSEEDRENLRQTLLRALGRGEPTE